MKNKHTDLGYIHKVCKFLDYVETLSFDFIEKWILLCQNLCKQ